MPEGRVSFQEHVSARHGVRLAELLAAVSSAVLQIERRLRTAPLSGTLGAVGATNVQGEQQQKLDVFANEALIEVLEALPSVAAIVSEEDAEPRLLAEHGGQGGPEFVVIFDPLDGSSNIDVNVNVGTIVSVVRVGAGQSVAEAVLQPGARQVAALYVNYGPATMLVYTAGAGVDSFTLDGGDFMQNAQDLRMPACGPYYSVNEGNAADFPASYGAYLAGLRDGSLLGRRYSSRYVGSFIADFHRTLLKGGVFLYPPTEKTPAGKLRLLYEANPMAWIAEQAGGAAVSGSGDCRRILEIVPSQPHQRTTLVIGSGEEVQAFQKLSAVAQGRQSG